MTSHSALMDRVALGLDALGLPNDGVRIERLLKFLDLLGKWGKAYNLTAIRDATAAVDLHLLDSLAICPHLPGGRILDVGTGAGLPGLPLAIMDEQRQFVLLDSSAKKIRFVQQVILELGLTNAEARLARIEDCSDPGGFDAVLARAFASLNDIYRLTRRLLAPGGRILAMKGRVPLEEIQALGTAEVLVHALAIPGLAVERHLIEIRTV